MADDSKHILSVKLGDDLFIMADIRLLKNVTHEDGRIPLEFFFDGETSMLKGRNPNGFVDFVNALESSINSCVQEYYSRKIRSIIMSQQGSREDLKRTKFPDVKISAIGDPIEEAFRDAGCMLSFIAVRVSVSEECSVAIGGIVFPEQFGMKKPESDDKVPVPKWLLGMGLATLIVAVATVYAWLQILLYGNSFS